MTKKVTLVHAGMLIARGSVHLQTAYPFGRGDLASATKFRSKTRQDGWLNPQTREASMQQSNPTLELDNFLPYRLSVTAEIVSRLFANRYEVQFGITIPEWRVLAVVAESGPITTQNVIERTRMDRVRVSRAAISLAEKDFLERTLDPKDQRAFILKLSRQGQDVYKEIVPLAFELQDALTGFLSPDERTQLYRILEKLSACAQRVESGKLLQAKM